MSEEVTVNDIAAFLEVSRKSAIQRMARLVKTTTRYQT
jgi:Mn-dependent DtxR family transcriptional regulator